MPTPTQTRDRLRTLALTTKRKAGFDSELVTFVVDPTTGALRLPRAPLTGKDGGAPVDLDEGLERVVYELRAPSIAGRGRIMQSSVKAAAKDPKKKGDDKDDEVQLDLAKLQVLSLIECAYAPATDGTGAPTHGGTERLFVVADFEELAGTVVGTHLDILAKKAQALVNLDPETVGKA